MAARRDLDRSAQDPQHHWPLPEVASYVRTNYAYYCPLGQGIIETVIIYPLAPCHEANNRQVPDSQAVLVSSATRLQNRLPKLWQWSTLSSGYGSTQELFDSCELGTGGTVSDAVKVTELTAQSYALAAEIYLHCRFFR